MANVNFTNKELKRLISRAQYHAENTTYVKVKEKWLIIKDKLEKAPYSLGNDELASIIRWEKYSLRTAIGEDRKFKEALIVKLERMMV